MTSLAKRARGVGAVRVLNLLTLREIWASRAGGHAVDANDPPHLQGAIDWLAAAQDATPDDGISRGYCFLYNSYFKLQGWQPSYPETTGYIIPTLFGASRVLEDPSLAARAVRAARWEIEIQLEGGAVQGGVIGEAKSPAVFNTGQVMLGWLSALEETGDPAFAEATHRAAEFLVANLDADGHWRKGNSRFARPDATLYNARVAWALAEAGARLGVPEFTAAAHRNLRAVAAAQHPNGWFPNSCLYQPERPLLHTIAYTIRGLLEGGRVLQDEELVRSASRAAETLLGAVRPDGSMSGQFARDWSPGAPWGCLTGQAQMANNWMRLHEITGKPEWLEPVPAVIQFLKSTQNRTSGEKGVRGGIRGSEPIGGEYGAYEILNWATKYFADALMRRTALQAGQPTSSAVSILA